ncbi:thioredoxin, putative [Trypanosoma equiperdum]|uniref:Thioredoxin domain-containing protein n=2 Tax=Trypanozoon TaxID=39700 RepID=Q38DH2_TRYB2|nr:hypothetical protein, conserved [Trypanosoma brucei brucei TREU927]EAN77148.1 hypothetical protein, conserved [Trypanosoma brucei brucei TREU927]SCU64412.1 thioredoxin, putative [Trypanosoma equiperdum]
MPPKRAGKSKKKPKPPPPVVFYISTIEEFSEKVEKYEGCCLVATVATHCSMCSTTVVPYLENLNTSRPAALAALNIVVINVDTESAELCKSLQFGAIPTFFSYSYGKLMHTFSGNNMDKALLIAKIAAQQAELDKAEAAAAAKELVNAAGGTAPDGAAGVADAAPAPAAVE